MTKKFVDLGCHPLDILHNGNRTPLYNARYAYLIFEVIIILFLITRQIVKQSDFQNWQTGFNYNPKSNDLKNTKMTSMTMTKPHCSLCYKEMQFMEGDIIFGEKWYHKDCKEGD